MLDRLLETGARRGKAGWGGTASVIVHGVIIGLAIVATANAKPPRTVVEGPILIPIAAPVPDSKPGQDAGGTPGDRTVADRFPLPPIVPGPVEFGIPIPNSEGAIGADSAALSDIIGSGGGATSSLPGTGIANDGVIDTPVRVLAERAPRYPETLRAAGIAGEVKMQFVIDTLGRVEPSSLRVLTSSHELFTRAVVASLHQARFTPGEVAGRRVRTLVERSFRFNIGAR